MTLTVVQECKEQKKSEVRTQRQNHECGKSNVTFALSICQRRIHFHEPCMRIILTPIWKDDPVNFPTIGNQCSRLRNIWKVPARGLDKKVHAEKAPKRWKKSIPASIFAKLVPQTCSIRQTASVPDRINPFIATYVQRN